MLYLAFLIFLSLVYFSSSSSFTHPFICVFFFFFPTSSLFFLSLFFFFFCILLQKLCFFLSALITIFLFPYILHLRRPLVKPQFYSGQRQTGLTI